MNHPLQRLLVGVAAAAALVATACSGSSSTPSATVTKSETQTRVSPTVIASTSTTAPTIGSPTATGSGTTGATGIAAVRVKVSANTASAAEIQAALQANGVPNPANWTREVIEYRPYPAEDANLTKLRQNLAKYNPGPGVVNDIVTALKP